eukprot:TRINITY_DN14998_c0_g1_i3.p1 TRINITY_DN14998_c0_g1~~TRINITY_DN14998_c0_g1_i3.p1  ORF type:complete len:678 (-),score=80.53 TRINITY_DN14998_c0_g1_i3:307-2340(-)
MRLPAMSAHFPEEFWPVLLASFLQQASSDGIDLVLSTERARPSFASPLHPRALRDALPEQTPETQKKTMDAEIIKWTVDGSIEFGALVFPGYGFSRWNNSQRGMWADEHPAFFKDYSLQGALVVFMAGFNDKDEDDAVLKWRMQMYADWYRAQGCKMAFVDANDHHGTNHDRIRRFAQEIAAADPDNIIFVPTLTVEDYSSPMEAIPYPGRYWSSEHKDRDMYHLTQEGIEEWLPVLREAMLTLAKKMDVNKVLVISDSTLQAHDYIPGHIGSNDDIRVIVQTLNGATACLRVPPTSSIADIKARITRSNFPRTGLQSSGTSLYIPRANNERIAAEDMASLAACGIQDGDIVLMDGHGVLKPEPGSPATHLPPPFSYVPQDFFEAVQETVPGLFRLPLKGHAQRPAGGGCYIGVGYRNGRTMTTEGYVKDGSKAGGIYCSSDINVARSYEHTVPCIIDGQVRRYYVLCECSVQEGQSNPDRVDLYRSVRKSDVEVIAFIIRLETSDYEPGAQMPSGEAPGATNDARALRDALMELLMDGQRIPLTEIWKKLGKTRQEVNKELHAMETDQLVRKVQDVPPLWQRALHAREAQEPTQTGSTRPQSGEGVSQVPVPLTDHLQRELYDKLTESRTSVALKQLVKETGQDKAVVNKALSELQKQGLAKQDEPASPPQWSAVR